MHIVHPSPNFVLPLELIELEERRLRDPGKPFDPRALVQAVRAACPERPELQDAFALCTHEWPESDLYTYFIPWKDHDVKWKYAGGFTMPHSPWGELVVDLVHDTSAKGGVAIGGIEYMDRVMGRAPGYEHDR